MKAEELWFIKGLVPNDRFKQPIHIDLEPLGAAAAAFYYRFRAAYPGAGFRNLINTNICYFANFRSFIRQQVI